MNYGKMVLYTQANQKGFNMSENCLNIIDELIEQRHNKGMTQKELAAATSLTQSVIARFESKKVTPQLDTLIKVADALGCELKIVPAK